MYDDTGFIRYIWVLMPHWQSSTHETHEVSATFKSHFVYLRSNEQCLDKHLPSISYPSLILDSNTANQIIQGPIVNKMKYFLLKSASLQHASLLCTTRQLTARKLSSKTSRHLSLPSQESELWPRARKAAISRDFHREKSLLAWRFPAGRACARARFTPNYELQCARHVPRPAALFLAERETRGTLTRKAIGPRACALREIRRRDRSARAPFAREQPRFVLGVWKAAGIGINEYWRGRDSGGWWAAWEICDRVFGVNS